VLRNLLVLLLSVSCGLLVAQPVIGPGSTVNAADYSRDIAPGAIITIFGTNLAPEYTVAAVIPLPTELAGTSVELTDGSRTMLLPLFYVMPGQLSAQLPYDGGAALSVRVTTPAGTSQADSFTVVPQAGRFFSVNQEGYGRAVALDLAGQLSSRDNPILPGVWVSLYANSMGAVNPPIQAGDGASADPESLNRVVADVSVEVDGREAAINYAGLAPSLAGAYQVNMFSPYTDLLGDIPIRMRTGESVSQLEMTVPVEPNGFYYVYGAGKFPNGQTRNAQPGPATAIVFRHEDPMIWGQPGYREWTTQTPTTRPSHATTSGLALTLMNGNLIVYDNNGIENGTFGDYYDNSSGAVNDNDKAGLWEWYSMVNNDYAIFAGHFKLTEAATFDRIAGYFDGNGRPELPFDPANVYNSFRMNIWSSGSDGMPANDAAAGNVFSSDTTPGTFSYSETTAARVFSDGATDVIHRMVYTLATPLTLPPGEYWFSHDTAVPKPMEKPDPGVLQLTQQRRPAGSRAYKPVPPASASADR